MRLTLRTLLAYLDNTLEPQDAEILRSKLSESGFATQLVQRIRRNLADPSLTAPSPEAVGPVEEANAIGEYLDSTLPAEQVAEIERACLESEAGLAEAAACHQILTMVLGKPAEVSPELRARIYELPEREIEKIAAASNRFSSLSIEDSPEPSLPTSELPTAESPTTQHGQPVQPVQPVGVSDSGVSDAPTRLRELEQAAAGNAPTPGATTAMAGSKPRSIDDRIYGGSIRPSRISPWLVSFTLAAVLLFALVQIFRPLLKQPLAKVDSLDNRDRSEEIEDSVDVPRPVRDREPEIHSPGDVPPSATSLAAEKLPPLPSTAEVETPEQPPADTAKVETPQPPSISTAESQSETADAGTPPMSIETPADPTTAEPAAAAAEEPPPAAAVEPPPAEEVVEPKIANQAATVTSANTLLASLVAGDPWVRLKNEMKIPIGAKIFCAPTFRGRMTSADGFDVTLVGPAQVQWVESEDVSPALWVDFGRILVSTTQPESSLNVQLGSRLIQLSFESVETVVAASIKHLREPGIDPLQEGNREELAGLLTVQGAVTLSVDGNQETLTTGQQWVKAGNSSQISSVDEVPDWIDPPDPAESTLESSAREGLLDLLDDDQPLDTALREATLFRRSEVAAVAGETLVHLGYGDVYFGSGGILSEPKQRAYWPDHFQVLLEIVDNGPESAAKLQASIKKMDSANADTIFRLLTGYSQKQLVEGGDQALVEMLDSDSTAVRVLALENLHEITGTTLYFRAEQENAVRRAAGVKKWVARQRKGDIRWPEE